MVKAFAGLLLLFTAVVSAHLIGIPYSPPKHSIVMTATTHAGLVRVFGAQPGDRVEVRAGAVYLNGKRIAYGNRVKVQGQ